MTKKVDAVAKYLRPQFPNETLETQLGCTATNPTTTTFDLLMASPWIHIAQWIKGHHNKMSYLQQPV
jgi:hypothetical protein